MNSKMTEIPTEKILAWHNNKGELCLFCESKNIQSEPAITKTTYAEQIWYCRECFKSWEVNYDYSQIEDIT